MIRYDPVTLITCLPSLNRGVFLDKTITERLIEVREVQAKLRQSQTGTAFVHLLSPIVVSASLFI